MLMKRIMFNVFCMNGSLYTLFIENVSSTLDKKFGKKISPIIKEKMKITKFVRGPARETIPSSLRVNEFVYIIVAPGIPKRNPKKLVRSVIASPYGEVLKLAIAPYFSAVNLCIIS